MRLRFPSTNWITRLGICSAICCASLVAPLRPSAQTPATAKSQGQQCRVDPIDYRGWHAEQLSNQWVQLVAVPQNGGRLMQVTLAGHPYLFVNPELAGKYLPPTAGKWFNYGGDKLWLLPEGNDDEQHWVGDSDLLDDGPFSFRKISEGKQCKIELTGPADPHTGIQFVRTVQLDAGSSRIRFHAVMKNVTGHDLEWSMQSVSQYNTCGFIVAQRVQSQFLDFHAGKSREQLSQSLSRTFRSRTEFCGVGERRWLVHCALRAYGR